VTEGNLELVDLLVSWAVSLPAVAAILVRDERHLRGVELERTWPPVSRDAAILNLWMAAGAHPLCLLVHFVRTRRNRAGWLLGIAWVVGVEAAAILAAYGAETAIDALGL
jgi:hypothetical protein